MTLRRNYHLERLRLQYARAPYGPYADNLRHVLHKIEGHFLSGYADGGDRPDKQLMLVPGAVEDASKFLSSKQETQKHFDRVSDLVDGFESPFGLELLATVHWVIKTEAIKSKNDVVECVYAWNERKRQFSARQIDLAIDVLAQKGWVDSSQWSATGQGSIL